MKRETILTNAKIVLANEIIHGSIRIENGLIKRIDEGNSLIKSKIDCEEDYLIPGLIEIHTDNLEKYIVPRPGIYWPSPKAAIIAHDNQIFSSGITTVLDAVSLGFTDAEEARSKILDISINVVKKSQQERSVKADHFLHLRCELPSSSVFKSFSKYVSDPSVRLVSVMDHTPGQRQWKDIPKWKMFNKDKKWSDEDAQAIIDSRLHLQQLYGDQNRKDIVQTCQELNTPIASHDDTTVDHCQEAWSNGITISEFPTTMDAAREARKLGMKTIMGAPNMVRGESHSGNVSAKNLVTEGLLDGFSSDYMPISLLHSAFETSRQLSTPLAESLSKVTSNIASMTGLTDRGEIKNGKLADFIRVRKVEDLPMIISVWKDGEKMLGR